MKFITKRIVTNMILMVMGCNCLLVVSVFAVMIEASRPDRAISVKAIGYAAKGVSPESGGPLSGKSSIISALSKVVNGKDDEGQQGLYNAIATMTNFIQQDRFLHMIGKDAIDFISTSKDFEKTQEAIANYNYALYTAMFKESGNRTKRDVLKKADRAMFFVNKAFNDELYKLSDKSAAIKHLKKFNTWTRRQNLVHIMEFAFDVISLRVDLKLLQEGLDEHKEEKIVASCLGICAGVVGLDNFVSAVSSEIQILNGNGLIVGGILNIAVTLMKIHENREMQKETITPKPRYESYSVIANLGERSKRQLHRIMSHVADQDISLNDIYIVNKGVLPKWGILYGNDRGPLQFGAFENGGPGNAPLYRKEDSSDLFLVAGQARRITKAQQPKGDKETSIIGFDFYGIFATGYPYKGSTILVSTDGVHTSDYRLNGLRINTCLQKPWFHPNDHLLLADMSNLDQGERIEVFMGKGDDVLMINGMFGQFMNESSGNILDIDLGAGLNTLSFEGMSNKRKDIKGIFFDRKDSKLSYFHGINAKLHAVGTIKFVHVLIGSPFHDYVILSGYSDGNPNGNDFTVVQHSGANFYEVDVDQAAASKFRVIDNSKKTPTIVIRTSNSIKRNELVFAGNMFKIYKKRKQDGQAKPVVHIHIISRNIPVIKVVDANDNSLIRDIKANFLAPEYYKGLSMVTKGRTMVNGSNNDDVCVLECKTNQYSRDNQLVVIDLGEGQDAIVIKDSTFLDPCGINDKDFNLWLKPRENEKADGEWYILIEEKATGEEIRRYLLKGVEKIINAFGSLITDLVHKKLDKVDLLDTFISVTTHEVGLFH